MAINKITTWLSENVVIAIIGVTLSWLSWSNHAQLETIGLKQDKAIIQTVADVQSRFVSQQSFESSNTQLHQSDASNAAAIQLIANSLSELKTDIAVIKSELQKQNR